MKTIRRAATIVNQIKSQFAICTLYRIIDFSFRCIYFPHNDFKVIDQRFHIGINLLFGWQIKIGHFRMKHTFRLLFDFFQGLLNDAKRLPHFFISDHKSVIYISRCSNRHIKIKLLIGTVGVLYPDIIIYTCCS
ncbi:hypothetical protein D3C81_818800 [compost metagenome]